MYSVTFREPGKEDWARCRAAPIKHKECIENFGSGATKIESTSVMKNDFRHHEKPERATLHRPQPETQVEGGAFETNTSYKKDFSKKEIRPVQAIRPKEYQAPTAQFEGSSTVKSDYTAHPAHRREPPFRPPINQQPDKTEFSSSTTTGQAYVEWPARRMEKPAWAKQKAYEPTPNENVYSSSYQSDYVRPAGYQRAHLVKPVPQDKDLLHGPSDPSAPKVTHYKEQFVAFSGKTPARSFKQNQVYEPPIERFQAESVYQSNYTGEHVSPAQAIVPQQRRNSDPHAIDLHTTYKDTFKAERPASCPAKELLTSSDEFGHIGFKNGHQYYIQKSPRRCKTPKSMDPIFPATPESQKTDRERSSSRPPSAGKTPRSPSKTDRPTLGHSSRPTTPRASSRPTSARKQTSKTPETSPRKGLTETKHSLTATNRNNSNSNATKGINQGNTRPQSSKTDNKGKTLGKNTSSGSSRKTSPRPVSVGEKKEKKNTDSKVADKPENKTDHPPPIRRPKKDTTGQSEVSVPPNSTPVALSTDSKSPAVPALQLHSTPAGATTTADSGSTVTPTVPPAVNAGPAKAPVTNTSDNSVEMKTTKDNDVQSEVPATKPSDKSVGPAVATTPPKSTTAPIASSINSEPLNGDLSMSAGSAPAVQPSVNQTPVTSTTTSVPASMPPPTLVAAPPAPNLAPQQPVATMDLSMFDTPTTSQQDAKPSAVPPKDVSPKMPVIAPPPAPAQPVVRMGNGPREGNLLN